jgi:CheY-like chemotaxis protein
MSPRVPGWILRVSDGSSTESGHTQCSEPATTTRLSTATVQTGQDTMSGDESNPSLPTEPAGTDVLRLLLIDDQPRILSGLRMLLAVERGIALIGVAEDAESGVALARALGPDVVVMDIEMPGQGMDVFAATERLLSMLPACRVVILSLHDDAETRARAQAAGAAAVVGKHGMDGPLLAAIRSTGHTAGE